ncbi:Uu.00g060840.m01.CDS01 [Anthostomella pinea]|uniref:Uu.00g060840.m01.CDS01 n=1 Tax=Anthostomella pinea TaxID=933095 RepID=A0AAI8VT60_9PEZI|nr:Uu.00g060840.m01.CDS01 [Anthostomella pinea]
MATRKVRFEFHRKAVCIAASQRLCVACETAPTKQVLMSPMSYLHREQDPLVNVMVTPICERAECNARGKQQVNALISEVTGMAEGEVRDTSAPAGGSDGQNTRASARILRNAQCPCGSGLKYKKCCGAAAGGD